MAVPYRRTFVRLLGFLRPYRRSLWVSVVLAATSQGLSIAIAALTGRVIDKAIRPHDRGALWLYVGLIAGLGLAKALTLVGRRLISGRQALGVEFDMRNALYAKLVRLSALSHKSVYSANYLKILATRGKLRVVRDGRLLLSSRAWLAEYVKGRDPRGGQPARRAAQGTTG